MAKKPVRFEWGEPDESGSRSWVDFVGKLPMAKLEEVTTQAQKVEGESDMTGIKRMAVHIPVIVEAWSLESDPHAANSTALWDVEDAGDLMAIINAMTEYIAQKTNIGPK